MWLCTGVAETLVIYSALQQLVCNWAILIAVCTIAIGFVQKLVPLKGLKKALTAREEFRSSSVHLGPTK